MLLRSLLILSVVSLLTGCSNSRKLLLAFKEGTSFEKGMEVQLQKTKIGYVSDIKLHKKTILLKVIFDKKVKIPEGSQFILHEAFIGLPVIELLLSDKKIFLTSKDTIQGFFKPTKLGQ